MSELIPDNPLARQLLRVRDELQEIQRRYQRALKLLEQQEAELRRYRNDADDRMRLASLRGSR